MLELKNWIFTIRPSGIFLDFIGKLFKKFNLRLEIFKYIIYNLYKILGFIEKRL